MINLLPQFAKKNVQTEYWIRMISVYGILWASALLLVTIMFIPVYVFITVQNSNLKNLSIDIPHRVDVSSQVLQDANHQAFLLLTSNTAYEMSTLQQSIESILTPNVTVRQFRLQQTKDPILVVGGNASSRLDLVAFRDALEEAIKPVTIDLPIGNLVKDRDVEFIMTLTLATSTPS